MKSIFLYPGSKGKKSDLKQIIHNIPEHELYIEPFLGGASIFLNKDKKYSILNDINCELMNCYKEIKDNTEEVVSFLPKIDTKITDFKDLWKQLKTQVYFNEAEIASNFIFINRTSYQGFGGMLNNSSQRYNYELIKNRIIECSKYLKDAEIYCGDGIKWINYQTDKKTFVFIDPPYINSNNKACYKKINWQTDDFKRLCEELKVCKHKWLLTIDKNQLVYELLSEFYITEYRWKKFKAITGQHEDVELYVSNFPLK